GITATKDIRIRIPATFNMTWNTALTTASITGSGNGKVSRTVSYEDGGKTLVIDVTSNFGAGDRIVVSGLQYMAFTAASAPDYLQLVVSGAGGGTTVRDSRTIQVVAPTMASAGDQVFVVGQAPAAISPITITDAPAPTITAAKVLRIRHPASFNMSWNTALTTATLTGSAAGKVAPTVSYEDGGKTLVLNVTADFGGNDQLVVSGLQYKSFTAPSAADYLQLVISGAGGGTVASDSRTIQVVQPTIASSANQLYVVGAAPSAADYLQLVVGGAGGGTNASDSRTIQVVAPTISSSRNNIYEVGEGPTAISPITITDAASPTITAAKGIRIRIPATLNMIWDTGRTTDTVTGSAAAKVATTVSYEDGGKTLVLNVTTNFAANDQIVVSGLRFVSFAALSPPDRLQLVISGAGAGTAARDDKTIVIATPTACSGVCQGGVYGDVALSMGRGLSYSYDSRVGPYNPATAGSNGDLASNTDVTLSRPT